ncbi:MAG: hypothetical protein RI996_391 [Candidatus Parcubacteria bacterium]|jgi:hypothetical protein
MKKTLLTDISEEIQKVKPRKKYQLNLVEERTVCKDCNTKKVAKLSIYARKILTVHEMHAAMLHSDAFEVEDLTCIKYMVELLRAALWLEIFGVYPELANCQDSISLGNNWWILHVDTSDCPKHSIQNLEGVTSKYEQTLH